MCLAYQSGRYTDSQIADIINNLKGDGFKNNPLRQAYENEVAGLKSYGEELLSSGMSEEQVARTLNQARRDLGIKYKNATPQPLRDYPEDGMIEYISYFVQDEIINNISDTPVIINEGMGISICNKDFNENNMNVTVDGKFKFWKSENAILILKDNIEERVLNAYRINDLNNLLFLGDDFVGIEFKNLNQEEMIEIKNSKCLL